MLIRYMEATFTIALQSQASDEQQTLFSPQVHGHLLKHFQEYSLEAANLAVHRPIQDDQFLV